MNKPSHFVEVCTATRNMPYQCVDLHSQGQALTGGVFSKGALVWLEASFQPNSPSTHAWSEEVGIIWVDARLLRRGLHPVPPRMTLLPALPEVDTPHLVRSA